MTTQDKDWFETWFDTPYYHKLYKHRDDHEARKFMDALLQRLQPSDHWLFCDLACGRGRHARYLHSRGFRVKGIDLSPQSIEFANRYAQEGLSFEIGDMRNEFAVNEYDVVLNLFTSFGYFDNLKDNYKACESISKALKPGGYLLLDFMNVHRVAEGLVEEEVRKVGDIEFHINRGIEKDSVIKSIQFEAEGRVHSYREKVQLLTLEHFTDFFENAGLRLRHCFGDYQLHPFDQRESKRLILMAQK